MAAEVTFGPAPANTTDISGVPAMALVSVNVAVTVTVSAARKGPVVSPSAAK